MSGYDDIQTAAIVRYPYLWARESGKGETEAGKIGRLRSASGFPGPTAIWRCSFRSPRSSPTRLASPLKFPRLKNDEQGWMPICGFGLSSMRSTAM